MLPTQVALQNTLHTVGISLLSIQRRAGHVRHHGVSTAEGVLGVAQRVVLGSGLWEPHVTTIAAQVAGFQSVSDVFLDNYGAAGGVDEPGSCEYVNIMLNEREFELALEFASK